MKTAASITLLVALAVAAALLTTSALPRTAAEPPTALHVLAQVEDVAPALRSTPGRVAVRPGPYRAPIGTVLGYAIAANAHVDYGDHVAATTSEVRGQLELVVAQRTPSAILAAVRMLDAVALGGHETAGARDKALEHDLASTTWVELAADGRLLRVGFDPECAAAHRPWIVSLVASLQFAAGVGASWTVDERDASGVAAVEYRRDDGGVLARTKLTYRGDGVPHIAASSGRGRLDDDHGFMAIAQYGETLELALGDGVRRLRHHLQFSARLTSGAQLERVPQPGDGVVLREPCADGAAVGDATAALEEWRRQQIGGASTAELIAAISRASGTHGPHSGACHEAVMHLAWQLADSAAAVAEAALALDTGSLDGQSQALVLSALGAAGTAEAQQVLATIAAARERSELLRYGAVRSLAQVETPTAATVAAVRELLGRPDGSAAVRSVARLVAGGYVARLAGEAGSALLGELLAAEPLALDLELVDWFEALGNSGSPRTVAVAERYLSHDDAQVRGLALAVLRRVADASATALLEQAGHDDSAFVRTRAVELLAERRGEPRVRAFLQQMASADPDPALRERAQQLL
jgi:hypothetical protein